MTKSNSIAAMKDEIAGYRRAMHGCGHDEHTAMLLEKPGCYIWMGQAEPEPGSNHNQSLHTPQYDFNDEIIPLGVEYWWNLK